MQLLLLFCSILLVPFLLASMLNVSFWVSLLGVCSFIVADWHSTNFLLTPWNRDLPLTHPSDSVYTRSTLPFATWHNMQIVNAHLLIAAIFASLG
jgi:hypothetical protein